MQTTFNRPNLFYEVRKKDESAPRDIAMRFVEDSIAKEPTCTDPVDSIYLLMQLL